MADQALKATIKVFKSPAVYTRASDPENPIPIDGVFTAAGKSVDPQTGAPVQSVAPTFGIRLADLPEAPDAGDQLTVKGATYNVIGMDPDGSGGAELTLEKVG